MAVPTARPFVWRAPVKEYRRVLGFGSLPYLKQLPYHTEKEPEFVLSLYFSDRKTGQEKELPAKCQIF